MQTQTRDIGRGQLNNVELTADILPTLATVDNQRQRDVLNGARFSLRTGPQGTFGGNVYESLSLTLSRASACLSLSIILRSRTSYL